MKRRDFVKITAGGLAVTAMGTFLDLPPMFRRGVAHAGTLTVNLEMVEVLHEMVDITQVYSWAFAAIENGNSFPGIPGPVIFAIQGDTINLNVKNSLRSTRSFAIRNNNQQPFVVSPVAIAAGATAPISFTAPAPGTYIYEDVQDGPLGRALGLHGVLVVMPFAQPAGAVNPNPYGTTGKIMDLFNHLGKNDSAPGGINHFPGVPWDPQRQVIWVFSEVYPGLSQAVLANGGSVPSGLLNTLNNLPLPPVFIPEYFTINGRSGYFSAEDHMYPALPLLTGGYVLGQELGNALVGDAGDPFLIRNVHVGLDTHSPHIHANHGYILAVDGDVLGGGNPGGLWWVDTWTMLPGNRKDVLYPMMVPPDIPTQTWTKMKNFGAYDPNSNTNGSQEKWALRGDNNAEFLNMAHPPALPGQFTPLTYPMHSHQEISQSAAGGNYPMGMITHIEFTGYKPGT